MKGRCANIRSYAIIMARKRSITREDLSTDSLSEVNLQLKKMGLRLKKMEKETRDLWSRMAEMQVEMNRIQAKWEND